MKRIMDLSFPVWTRLLLAACAIVFLVPAGQVALGQQAAAKPQTPSAVNLPKAAQTEATPGETKPAKPGHEGIAVHGHWVIDVRNPDGSLAQHREFENSVTGPGQVALVTLLVQGFGTGDWAIVLGPSGSNGPCGGTSQTCEIVRVLTTQPALKDCPINTCSAGLTIAESLGTFAFTLAGTATATQPGNIGSVGTIITLCSGATYQACVLNTTTNNTESPFTSTTITSGTPPVAAPIPVTAGQLIQASVTIGFS